jgi:hypothetical protein
MRKQTHTQADKNQCLKGPYLGKTALSFLVSADVSNTIILRSIYNLQSRKHVPPLRLLRKVASNYK